MLEEAVIIPPVEDFKIRQIKLSWGGVGPCSREEEPYSFLGILNP